MKTENKVLMAQAREALTGNWGIAVGVTAIFTLVNMLVGMIPMASLIIGGPMSFGVALFFLSLSRKQVLPISDLFKGFNYFLNTLVASLLILIYTILWALLLIIPGIIAAISYSQVFFILAQDPSISASDAIKKSKEMMFGYKWKFFFLGLRFIGWLILCILTLGIGFLWLVPYMQVTFAKFHDDIRGGAVAQTTSPASTPQATPESQIQSEVVNNVPSIVTATPPQVS